MNVPKVVIGAGYGDEGKGLITDYLTSKHGADVVVRFNGGAQAGHTVETPAGERHVFSHLSSGTFNGAATYLSKHFVLNPFVYFKELEDFRYLVRSLPEVYVDPRAWVTTPYDMLINQLAEEARSTARHGSCGLGFGETIQRSENMGSSMINFLHLGDGDELTKRLEVVRDMWFPKRCAQLGIDPSKGAHIVKNDNIFKNFIADAQEMFNVCNMEEPEFLYDSNQIIFEGAQGLLLDQDFGDFPHVTRSNTGLVNVEQIMNELGETDVDIYYVTRCYQTRHGAGPLDNELPGIPYPDVYDETNVDNKYQGSLRFAYLNLDQLKEAIKHDGTTRETLNIRTNLAITCLDQVDNEIKAYKNGRLVTLRGDSYGDVGDLIYAEIGLNGELIKSFGPTRATITHRE